MKINIKNDVPNINVYVNSNGDGSYSITLSEANKRYLRDFKPGDIVKIGEYEFIVLEHSKDTTAVITKDFTESMEFGANSDYVTSNVRKYCITEFYNSLKDVIGAENIIEHTVKLVADDGTNKRDSVKDRISILTTDLYRRYREFLPAYGDPWWTATKITAFNKDYSHNVCFVDSIGTVDYCGCCCVGGVRPFCILNSSIMV